jgi:hypothetical protein
LRPVAYEGEKIDLLVFGFVLYFGISDLIAGGTQLNELMYKGIKPQCAPRRGREPKSHF